MAIKKSFHKWATILLTLAALVALYCDPFIILWWPQKPAKDPVPLDMAKEAIDDMYDGCRPEIAAVIDSFAALERRVNKGLDSAWAVAERQAKKPIDEGLTEAHAVVLHLYTSKRDFQQNFNSAVKEGKQEYGTSKFRFHYFYFYLTDAIQILRQKTPSCRTCYFRTYRRYDFKGLYSTIRFGTFVWATSSKDSFESNGKNSCFEIDTCYGADVTFYSAKGQEGQVLIPPYEVFTITHVLRDAQWCNIVYKLQSTKMPLGELNCKLQPQKIQNVI
ncbi:GPI-linked NAD(P)(+)--arginine ADP-ribosyltransferase 1-like [Stigmatopora argus]